MTVSNYPNVLLIVMDCVRAGHLSCYGYQRPNTPCIDELAGSSVVYEQAISPSDWSLPAHASIFTGLYPSKHGAHDEHRFLSADVPTMAEVLSNLGYRTIGGCLNAYVDRATGLDRGFQIFYNSQSYKTRSLLRYNLDRIWAKLTSTTDQGARWINKQLYRELQRDDRPWFVFAQYLEPHAPYQIPRPYRNRYLNNGLSFKQAMAVNQDYDRYLAGAVEMDGTDFEIFTALYDTQIAYLDSRIGQLIDFLKRSKMLDNTLIMITADHGENLGEHQLMGHRFCLYDTLLHVPLIIHYPRGTVVPGRVRRQVQTHDLLPTVLALLGDTHSATYQSLQGLSLLDTAATYEFTIAEQALPNLVVFQQKHPGADMSRYNRRLKMIRTERYKYIWASNGQHELYDLQTDPGETCNIIAEQPNVADDLANRLEAWRNSFEPAYHDEEAPEFDETVKARLRDLGYLE